MEVENRRNLTNDEILVINIIKTLENSVLGYAHDVLKQVPSYDQECINEGITNIQQGFMWIVRGITK